MKIYIVESAAGFVRCLSHHSPETMSFLIILLGPATDLQINNINQANNIYACKNIEQAQNLVKEKVRSKKIEVYFCDENFNFDSAVFYRFLERSMFEVECILLSEITHYLDENWHCNLKAFLRRLKYGKGLRHRRKINGVLVPYYNLAFDRKIIVRKALKTLYVLPKCVIVVCPLTNTKVSGYSKRHYRRWCYEFVNCISKLINTFPDTDFLLKYHPRERDYSTFAKLLKYNNCRSFLQNLPLELFDCSKCYVVTLLSSVNVENSFGCASIGHSVGVPKILLNDVKMTQLDMSLLKEEIEKFEKCSLQDL